jgi:glycosyltransferase involved in cell wall biosynthesis
LDASKLPIPRTNRLRDALTIPGGRQILLYQGNIVSRIRNLENVIDGMALLRRDDLALVFMGPDNGGGDELVERANKLGLLGRSVFFHPAVRQSELLSYTVSADAGLIPYTPVDWNTKFCTPNKLYEFIVAELPILANDLPELIRFVGNQGIGVNHPMSCAEEVAYAIESFFGNDVRQYRMRLREVSSRFVWQNHEGPRVVELYEAMALSPARAKDQELIREPRCAELPA